MGRARFGVHLWMLLIWSGASDGCAKEPCAPPAAGFVGLKGLEVVPGNVGITLGSPSVPGERRCISEDSKTLGEINFGGVGQEALFFESSSGSTCRAWSCRTNSVAACLAATHHGSSGWGDLGPSVALSRGALSYS